MGSPARNHGIDISKWPATPSLNSNSKAFGAALGGAEEVEGVGEEEANGGDEASSAPSSAPLGGGGGAACPKAKALRRRMRRRTFDS